MRWRVGSATSISVWQHVKLSSQIRPWDTLACCWDIKQSTNNNTHHPHTVPIHFHLSCSWVGFFFFFFFFFFLSSHQFISVFKKKIGTVVINVCDCLCAAYTGILRWQGRIWRLVSSFIGDTAKGDSCDPAVLAQWDSKLYNARNFTVKEVSLLMICLSVIGIHSHLKVLRNVLCL